MSETPLMRRVQVALARAGARIFRNQEGTYHLADGRYISSGLCEGSSDLIGWTPVTVTAAMVGRQLAVFTAVEVKAPGARTKPERLERQTSFIRAVKTAGGIAFFTSFEAEAVAQLAGGPYAG